MAYDAGEKKPKLPFTDDQLLAFVASERQDSVGFDNDNDELLGAREKALKYFKGEVSDLPLLKNRSQVVSMDVSDAVETVFPDLMEVFFGGDDIVTFRPIGPEDMEKAEQETEAIRQVLTEENPGFLHFGHVIKDSLITRTGVFRMYWDDPEYDEQIREVNAIELDALMQMGAQITDVEEPTSPEQPFKVTIRTLKHPGMARYEPVPSEDFAVARDTVRLCETTYAAHRGRPRKQDLIADGFDPDKVRMLPPYDSMETEEISNARDFADEHDADAEGMGDLARVEVIYHVIKLLNPDTKELQYYSVCTGNNEAVLLHAEEIEYVPYAAITPYLVPHRLFGRSVADLMIDIQKVKTNLVRMMLDQGLFALNQRAEVAEDLASEYTISDLLNNIPGAPIRVRQAGAIRPVPSAGLSFDVLGAMETIDLAGEKRTGIMRFGQGMKADTLHDTMGGAIEQAAMMLKRIRLMARMMAETGVKELAVGLHKIMRLHSTHTFKLRRGKEFVPLDPNEWADRQDMSIEIGVGSGGRREKIENRKILGDAMGSAIQYQGGTFAGPLVTAQNAHAYYTGLVRDLGFKDADKYFTDPSQAGQAPPDPEKQQMGQMLQQLQGENQELKGKAQIEMAKLQTQTQLKQMQMDMEASLKQQQMQIEASLKQVEMYMRNQTQREVGMAKASSANVGSDVRFGGEVG
ncbi:MAG TPA: hypothetical protein DCL48_08955 [Alphaproteobacteria bacterium]|nr:hypothetical protein [Alphaproteobacteria bacterium]